MICFELRVNDEEPVIAGGEDMSVISVAATYVASHDDLRIEVGGMTERTDTHEFVRWRNGKLAVGDVVSVRILDTELASEPTSREQDDPELAEKARRQYYEKLKKEFEGSE